MSHRVAKIQEWQERALGKHVESADESKRLLVIQEALKEHYVTLLPILADLHIICDMRSAKIVNRFFEKDNDKTRKEAAAEIATYKAVQRLIENLMPDKNYKEHFNELRRSRVSGP
jgi:hypothetical protein